MPTTWRGRLTGVLVGALLAACDDAAVQAVKKMPSAVPGRTMGQVLDGQPLCSRRVWQKDADPRGEGRVTARYECVINVDAALRQRLAQRARLALQQDSDFHVVTAQRLAEGGTLKMYVAEVDRVMAEPELEARRPGATQALVQLRSAMQAYLAQLASLGQACVAELRETWSKHAQAAQEGFSDVATLTERPVFSLATPERLATQVTLLRNGQPLAPSVRHEQPLLQGMQRTGQTTSNERDDPEVRQLATWVARAGLQPPDDGPLPCSQREAMDQLAHTRPPISQVLQNLPGTRP